MNDSKVLKLLQHLTDKIVELDTDISVATNPNYDIKPQLNTDKSKGQKTAYMYSVLKIIQATKDVESEPI